MHNRIITIGRQYGSGGREIGEQLTKRLGVDDYDTLLLFTRSHLQLLHRQGVRSFEQVSSLH